MTAREERDPRPGSRAPCRRRLGGGRVPRARARGGLAPRARLRALGFLLLAIACAKKEGPGSSAAAGQDAGARDAAATPSLRTPWVKARNAEDVAMLEAPATVLGTPESNAGVSPPFRARIVRVRVKPGAAVRRGDVVADVVMPEVVQAAGTYASAATRVGAYQRRLEQLEELKKEGMVRLSELLDVRTKLAEARADQQGALAMLRVAGLAAEDATRLVAPGGSGEVALRSPIDGVVTLVKAAIGENREAAGEPLVRIAGEGEPRVEARCARVMPQRAEYELWLATGERHPLRIVGRAPQVDPRDGTTLVWFAPAEGIRLVQGQTGKVKIRLEEEEGVVAVPAHALGLGPKGPFIVANRGGRPERVEVEVVAASGAEALIRGGAKIGDEVAADAAQAEEGTDAGTAPRPPDQDADPERRGT
jgi:membrane fusion protein, heavy metal efflux system